MEIGVLGFLDSKNIGDYIQSQAVIDLIDLERTKFVDRENLDKYDGNNLKTIINGWFMEKPNNWPPSKKIKPLFLSFHINPSIVEKLLNKESIQYFKKNEPIGCRDYYTRDVLLKKGVKAFYSSCLTTTIDRKKYLKDKTPKGIIVIGAFDRLNPTIDNKSIFKLLLSIIKYPLKKIIYTFKLIKFNKHLLSLNREIKTYSQIVKKPLKSHQKGLELAKEMLEKIAKSEIIITSRIHAALPALAMGLKVIFIDEGLDHDNHKQRLLGLKNYFTCVSFKDFFMINFDTIKQDLSHKEYVYKIKKTINNFKTQ